MRWQVGLTTVPERMGTLLPRTLASLSAAGWDRVRLFCDGVTPRDWDTAWPSLHHLEVTLRHPRLRTFANWALALAELYARDPQADRYAMFQDDLIACRNLRPYLERTTKHEHSYFNLYLFPSNAELCPAGYRGWYPARTLSGGAVFDSGVQEQTGRGAVGLVFTRSAVLDFLGCRAVLEKPLNAGHASYKKVDGAVANALNKAGYTEMVHSPPLIQHLGHVSSMGNRRHHDAPGWRGEQFDALSLLPPDT